MGVSKSSSLTLMLVVVAVDVVCGGNVHVDTCPIGFNCLQCISGQSSEVERCMQLRLLITQTVNHPREMELYCTENCPIVLATANYYCGAGLNSFIISSIFDACESYSVEPTGEESFRGEGCSVTRSCELCVHGRSKEVRKCLQHHLLAVNTNNTNYRATFCIGDCPLTLSTSNWYCGGSTDATFTECRSNIGGRYCNEIMDEVVADQSYQRCISQRDCMSADCNAVINKYECCLTHVDSSAFFRSTCNVPECSVETGGSPALLATPLLIAAMLLMNH